MKMVREKKVISGPFGGMGDWLLLSTLPRRLHEAGYEVFVHDGPLSQWRNSEVKALFMANPYISKENGGFSTLPPNAGLGVYVDLWGRFCYETRLRPADPIALIEEINGLEPPYSHAPEIYPPMDQVQMNDNIIIIDPYSSSVPFTQDSVGPWIDFYSQHHYKGKTFHVVETPGYAAFHRSLFSYPKIQVKNLSEYIGLLRSCHAFFGVESGGQMLAAAVKQFRPELKVHALFSTRGANQKFYRLPESVVLTDTTAFAIQNDFAIDPGMLGYLHIIDTGEFAARTRAAEAEAKPEPIPQAFDLINSPQVIKQYADVGDGFPTPIPSEASM